jgi:hypothetical protein
VTSRIGVTDHAVIRWLERVQGIDPEAIREQIRAVCAEAIEAGAVSLNKPEGTYIIQSDSRCAVTILAPGMLDERSKRWKMRPRYRPSEGARAE